MTNYLVELEQEALRLQNEGSIQKAADLFKQIIEENPAYEHGSALYSLAHCLEDLGRLDDAEKYYADALKYEPNDSVKLGGYASFLYLHGDPQKAFNAYLKLYRLEKKWGGRVDDLVLALKALGKKMGLTDEEVIAKIENI